MVNHRTGVTRQDEEAFARLRGLASGASVIEGARSKPGLLASAVSAMGRIAHWTAIGLMGTAAVTSAVAGGMPQNAYAMSPARHGMYGKVVAEMQVEAEALLGKGNVVVYDRSAPREAEIARVSSLLGWSQSATARLTGKNAARGDFGAYQAWSRGPDSVCIVVGPKPEQVAHKLLGGWWSDKVELGDVTDEVALTATFRHEIGHCLHMNEGQADAFAALMSAKDGKSKDLLPLLTVSRELDEYMLEGDDDHSTSTGLRWILEKTSDAVFMEKVKSSSDASLANFAKSVVPNLSAVPARTAGIRDALAALGGDGGSYVVPVEEGFVITGQREWLKANSEVPEFAHMLRLGDYMTAPAKGRVVPPALKVDAAASRQAITDIAATGDPMVAKLAPVFGASAPAKGSVLAHPVHRASDVKGQLVSFDRDSAEVRFARDAGSFVIRDVASGKAVAAGSVREGITKTFGAVDHQADLELGEAAITARS